MNKFFRLLLIAYLVTSPVLILFLAYKTVFLTKKIFELQNDLISRESAESFPVALLSVEHVPFIGAFDARVKIFWFTDIDCDACRASFLDIQKLIKIYPNEIVVFFKFLPGENDIGSLAHRLLLDAWQQGQFFDLTTLLYSNSASLNPSSLAMLEKELKFRSPDSATQDRLNRVLSNNLREFQALSTHATPTFVVNGKVWHGADEARLLREVQAHLPSD